MRDPQARLEFTEKLVFRHLLQNLPENHVLFSDVANEWVQENLLIEFTWRSTHLLESPRIAFVTSPEEWSNQQFYDAALLTLQLLEKANLANSDLKDASAWNIIFDGCKPKFCDLTSFTPLDEKNWWAGGQFVRHFISPLWLARENGFQARDFFRISRDGVLPEIVQKALGLRRFFSRCWPLVASAQSKAIPTKNSETSKEDILIFRKQLLISLNWMYLLII